MGESVGECPSQTVGSEVLNEIHNCRTLESTEIHLIHAVNQSAAEPAPLLGGNVGCYGL